MESTKALSGEERGNKRALSEKTSIKISYMEFILCLTIVLYHIGWNENLSGSENSRVVYMFIKEIGVAAVPMFSFLTGFLFYRNIRNIRDNFTKMKKRVRSLLIPYLLWNILFYFLYGVVLARFHFFEVDLSFLGFLKTFWNVITMPHLWYVRNVFLLALASPIIYLTLRNRYVGIAVLGICTLCLIIFHYQIKSSIFSGYLYLAGSFWGLHNAQILGGCKQERRRRLSEGREGKVLILAGALVLFLLFWIIHYRIEFRLVRLVCQIGMGLSLWKILDVIPLKKHNFIHFSFWIYVLHHPLDKIGKWFYLRVTLQPFLYQFLVFSTSFAVALGSGMIAKRFFPKLYKVLSGGR